MSEPADPWDLLPDGVVIAGADGVVTLVNGPAARMLGPVTVVGAALAEAMALQDQDGNDWFATVRPYDGLGTRSGIPEQAWHTADGTELLVHTRLWRARHDAPVEQVAVVLRSARGRALLDRERSDLVATVAHELRSPLTGVKGFVTTLINRWDRLNDEQKLLMLNTVSSDSERLSRLITELLDVARIDTGRLPLHPRPLPLRPVLERVVDSVRQATARELRLDCDDVEVFADPDKLTQVFTNLVENGVRHGEGTVEVTARGLGETVEIVVDDEGEGIAESIRSRVFTKFWKHGVTAGSGLGMYIVNGLVRAHGGEVRIAHSPSGGARIVVTWPTTDRRP